MLINQQIPFWQNALCANFSQQQAKRKADKAVVGFHFRCWYCLQTVADNSCIVYL